MYSGGNRSLGYLGTAAGYCPLPQCQSVSGATAVLQYAIYGDKNGYLGLTTGEFIQHGINRKFPYFNKWFKSFVGGGIGDEMSNGRYSGDQK